MQPETIFPIVNISVLPFWLLLVFAPSWSWTQRLSHSALIPLSLGAVYAVCMAVVSQPEGADALSVSGVSTLFGDHWIALVGWIHYLVFDLFVGAWIARDARRRHVPHWLLVPCLLLTLMYGPIGLGSFLIIRAIAMRRASAQEKSTKTSGVWLLAEH